MRTTPEGEKEHIPSKKQRRRDSRIHREIQGIFKSLCGYYAVDWPYLKKST
jgi:hypothetical protein